MSNCLKMSKKAQVLALLELGWSYRRIETETGVRREKDPQSGWMEPSRRPAIDGSGSVIAFSSRRPTDARDRRDDFDLFVHRRCE